MFLHVFEFHLESRSPYFYTLGKPCAAANLLKRHKAEYIAYWSEYHEGMRFSSILEGGVFGDNRNAYVKGRDQWTGGESFKILLHGANNKSSCVLLKRGKVICIFRFVHLIKKLV